MNDDGEILARVLRSGLEESVHHGWLVVADVRGRVVRAIGDPAHQTFLRSSAKPFQAMTALTVGAGERFGWTDEELALVCASHTAEPIHLSTVRSILAKAGLTEDELQCGPHAPVDAAQRRRLAAAGVKPTRIHNNCSGKHAGMLAACVAAGWPTTNYLSVEHPLQKLNRETLARLAGVEASSIRTGVDGCGVPSFWISMSAAATAFARLANPGADESPLKPEDRRAAEQVYLAMTSHPLLIGGTGRFNSQLVEFAGPRLVAKSGAEGFFGVGLAGLGLGVALKIADGAARPHAAVLCRLLPDYYPELAWDEFRRSVDTPIHNTLEQIVGGIEPAF